MNSAPHRGLRVAYYFVSDPQYPRNRRIREYLEQELGAQVTVFRRSHARWKPLRILLDLLTPLITMHRYDVAIVAEYAITFAPIVCQIAALTGRTIIVDGFVAKHETIIGDWRRHEAASPIARGYALVDRLSATKPDLYLTDTAVRADAVRRRYGPRCAALALPVGAPAWARPVPPQPHDPPTSVLFYGLYVPLHGVRTILEAAAIRETTAPGATHFTLVGDGELRTEAEALATELRLDAIVTFRPPVPEEALCALIGAHDIVLGVFGDSEQARTVIPNKVWQGLACGRTVVTRQSPALAEIAPIAGALLVTVPPANPAALADAIRDTSAAPATAFRPDIADLLEASVRARFQTLADILGVPTR